MLLLVSLSLLQAGEGLRNVGNKKEIEGESKKKPGEVLDRVRSLLDQWC